MVACSAGGCGLQVSSPDLLEINRSGQGQSLSLLINDAGTIRCDRGARKPLGDPLLLKARELDRQLAPDAKARLSLPAASGTVFSYAVRLQSGTIAFGDRAAAGRPELAQLQLFVVRAAREACGLAG
jgi:hypothetical protein